MPSALVAGLLAFLWVPVGWRFLGEWRGGRQPLYLGLLSVVLWFVYHDLLFALARADASGPAAQLAELVVLFNLNFMLRRTRHPVAEKLTNGVNQN
jgi:hypothetical protein